ncbi:unnamed protein product [Symbiodinium natans]|uniref:Uncharacterized protein n=1 Tax=Symbiodinium natans TaxID=878477 RepID=A0A812T1I9_9DINO|nr:unnamed protein product [Symbiodinium natans]
MELSEDERVLRGLLQFFVCADARRSASEEVPLRLRYRELVLTTYCLPEVQINDRTANTSSEQAEEATVDVEALEEAKMTPSEVLDVEEVDDSQVSRVRADARRCRLPNRLEVVDVETPTAEAEELKGYGEGSKRPRAILSVDADPERSKSVAEAVAEAVDAAEAAEAAEAEVEAIMKEEVLRRALLDPEGEARRRRVQARKLKGGRRRWNFAGRAGRACAGDDRYREHEVDLECRRKLAFRARGRLRGSIEDQGDERQHGNVTKQREAVKLASLASHPGAQRASSAPAGLQERKRPLAKRSPRKVNPTGRRGRGSGRGQQKRLRLPPIDFPELPILIADGDDQDLMPEARTRDLPVVIQIDRECRQARAAELEKMRGDLTAELEHVRKERHDAAKELRQCCVAEAQAVEQLRQALKAAFGSIEDE